MFRRLITFGLFLILTACAPVAATRLPTLTQDLPDTAVPFALPSPLPVVSSATVEMITPSGPETSLTPEATPVPIPTETHLPLPTLDVTPNLTATAVPLPPADSGIVQITSPGPLSKIVSPIKVFGYAVPGHDNKARLDLYAEDGRVLASQLLQLNAPYKWAYFYWELPFRIRSVGQLGRLTLSTQDEYGRINAANSVHLLLLSQGSSIINLPGDLKERCIIVQPAAGQRLSGGILSVVGKFHPFNSLPLTVELIDRNNNQMGVQLVAIPPAANGGYVPFQVDIAYSISDGTWALLVVRQNDDRIGGMMYLYSQEIFLNP